MPTREDFEKYIDSRISQIQSDYIDLISGEIHRTLGQYPGTNHRMPICCEVMYEKMNDDDKILHAPPKRKGATLKIRYFKRNH